MTKFNETMSIGQQLRARADATANFEGGLAFELDPRTRLYTRVASALMAEKKFYESAQQADEALLADVRAVAETDPEFVLRLAAYARQDLNLRSVSVALLAEAAAIPGCKPYVRRWTPEIIRRADEPAEAIAYWVKRHGAIGSQGLPGGDHAFPASLTKGIADALRRFGEYHFAKYDRPGSVKLRDVLRIVRPKPRNDVEAALYRYLVRGDLDAQHLPLLAAKAQLLRKEAFDAEAHELAARAHATWEVLVSKFGSRAETWNAIDFPFMAGMRNLANFMRNGADQALDRVIAMLCDPRRVRQSKQLPFRFVAALRAVEHEVESGNPRKGEVLDAIRAAVEASVANLPVLSGTTFVTADNSGSMDSPLSDRGSVTYRDTANLLAAVANAACERAVTSVFGTDHEWVTTSREDSVLTNFGTFEAAGHRVGGSTNAHLAIRALRERGIRVDRIVLLSDMQCYDSASVWGGGSLAEELRRYRSQVNPEVFLYSVDLAGYGTSQFPQDERRVALLAGWSERFLEFVPLFEADATQAIDRIARWAPPGAREDDAEAA